METILLVFVLITFVAATFQIFLVNRTVFRSLTAVHEAVFADAFDRNCAEDRGDDGCEYSQDPVADGYGGVPTSVEWTPERFPEVQIPVLSVFRTDGLEGGDLRLSSNRPDTARPDDHCGNLPCKRTRVGAGTYKSMLGGIWLLRETTIDANALMNYVEWAAFTRIISGIQ